MLDVCQSFFYQHLLSKLQIMQAEYTNPWMIESLINAEDLKVDGHIKYVQVLQVVNSVGNSNIIRQVGITNDRIAVHLT